MKIAGIIAEYNPFHNGHAHHILSTREKTGCDYVVVCMSGSFTQRGEAACMDKWTRAHIALECGADAVFDLPALFAVRTADAFARGGVEILGGLGCDFLSFGSELADPELLQKLASLRENEPPE
ncbi:MAG: nucleotidyltransferase family protein, partial [Clostridia bacterium]|nr:nucleotidyltransferase family protein [Clostridia bacterium]